MANPPQKKFIPEYLQKEVENGLKWREIAGRIRKDLNLPDVNSRHGLKKIHANFDQVYRKLDSMYKKNRNHPEILGGIVMLLARMTADAALRDRLFQGGKFLPKALPLLETKATRNLIITLLNKLVPNATPEVCSEIANEAPRFLRLLRELPDDLFVCEFAYSLLCTSITKSTGVWTKGHAGVNAAGLQDHIPAILSSVLSAVQNPSITIATLTTVLAFSATVACFWNRAAKSSELHTTVLVACLRTTSIIYRCHALNSLLMIDSPDVQEGNQDVRLGQLQHWQDLQTRGIFPPSLTRVMTAYGQHRCETTIALFSYERVITALSIFFDAGDLYSLGEAYAFIAAIGDSFTPAGPIELYATVMGRQVPRTLRGEPHASDLKDLYMVCAKALRARGNPTDLNAADILEVTYLRLQAPSGSVGNAAVTYASRALQRSPDVAYFYYIIGRYNVEIGNDHLALQMVKQGLKANKTTPHIRFRLLHIAVICAGDLGIHALSFVASELQSGGQKFSEGVAFLTSTLEDARTFVADAPPDDRHMWEVLNWYMLCRLILDGPKLSTDLRELRDLFDKLDTCKQFGDFFGHTLSKTSPSLACERIVKYYAKAADYHSTFISNVNSWQLESTAQNSQAPIMTSNTEAFHTGWLNELDLNSDDQNQAPNFGGRISGEGPSLRTVPMGYEAELYMCTYCRNPSAVVRKCGGCGKARYCDSKCQKTHWPEHKAACKASKSS